MSVLVFNAGSATLKFALLRGPVENFGSHARMRLIDGADAADRVVPAPSHLSESEP